MKEIEKGLRILSHEDLPVSFTFEQFQKIAYAFFYYGRCASYRILHSLRVAGYIEVERTAGGGRVAIYREATT